MTTDTSRITGTQINYYAVCHRKLWLFSRGVEMERENEAVQIGKLLDESSYKRENKSISLDNRIVLDWAELEKDADGTTLVHEVKKGRSVEKAHRLQMLLYLSILRDKGVPARGQIDYPLLKRCDKIELSPEALSELQAALEHAAQIVEAPDVPPQLPKKAFCEKCAYFELCWS